LPIFYSSFPRNSYGTVGIEMNPPVGFEGTRFETELVPPAGSRARLGVWTGPKC